MSIYSNANSLGEQQVTQKILLSPPHKPATYIGQKDKDYTGK